MRESQLLPSAYSITLIVVDDGSSDGTFTEISRHAAASGPSGFRVVGIRLSRNFGQQAAIQAGLEFAFEKARPHDFFILMDSDLQHPPDQIPVIAEALQHTDHIQMVRHDNAEIGHLKIWSSRIFYRVFRFLTGLQTPDGASDFRGMTYRFVRAYLQLRERGRFNRGLFYWVGFPRLEVMYQVAPRGLGETKYSGRRMLNLALVAISQFSSRPLIWLLTAVLSISFLLCGLYLGFEALQLLKGAKFVPGWSSLVFIVSFWSGAIVLCQLATAVYVARLFDEIKSRPVYIEVESTEKSDPCENLQAGTSPMKS